MTARLRECLIVDKDLDGYCRNPATTNIGKLPACEQCARRVASLRDRQINRPVDDAPEERIRAIAASVAHLARNLEMPQMAKEMDRIANGQ